MLEGLAILGSVAVAVLGAMAMTVVIFKTKKKQDNPPPTLEEKIYQLEKGLGQTMEGKWEQS